MRGAVAALLLALAAPVSAQHGPLNLSAEFVASSEGSGMGSGMFAVSGSVQILGDINLTLRAMQVGSAGCPGDACREAGRAFEAGPVLRFVENDRWGAFFGLAVGYLRAGPERSLSLSLTLGADVGLTSSIAVRALYTDRRFSFPNAAKPAGPRGLGLGLVWRLAN